MPILPATASVTSPKPNDEYRLGGRSAAGPGKKRRLACVALCRIVRLHEKFVASRRAFKSCGRDEVGIVWACRANQAILLLRVWIFDVSTIIIWTAVSPVRFAMR